MPQVTAMAAPLAIPLAPPRWPYPGGTPVARIPAACRSNQAGSAALHDATPVHPGIPARIWRTQGKASDPCPHRLAGAQNSPIWTASVMIGLEPAAAHNGGSMRVVIEQD